MRFRQAAKKPKYGNEKCTFAGKNFDSVKECERYKFLLGQQQEGKIRNLQTQTKFEIIPKITGYKEKQLKTKTKVEEYTIQKPAYYFADFTYDKKTGDDIWEYVVEDVKGSKFLITDTAKLKFKLMLWRHLIAVRVVTKPTENV